MLPVRICCCFNRLSFARTPLRIGRARPTCRPCADLLVALNMSHSVHTIRNHAQHVPKRRLPSVSPSNRHCLSAAHHHGAEAGRRRAWAAARPRSEDRVDEVRQPVSALRGVQDVRAWQQIRRTAQRRENRIQNSFCKICSGIGEAWRGSDHMRIEKRANMSATPSAFLPRWPLILRVLAHCCDCAHYATYNCDD